MREEHSIPAGRLYPLIAIPYTALGAITTSPCGEPLCNPVDDIDQRDSEHRDNDYILSIHILKYSTHSEAQKNNLRKNPLYTIPSPLTHFFLYIIRAAMIERITIGGITIE